MTPEFPYLSKRGNKLSVMRCFLFFITTVAVFTAGAQQFTPGQADSLRQLLSKASGGAARIETLIHLGEYHIWKKGENKVDLDSANACLSEAAELNKTVRSTALAGHQLLMKGFMLTEAGKRKEGQEAVEQSIPLLQKSNSQRLLGLAYFELQAYYDYSDDAQCLKRIEITRLAVEAFHRAGGGELEGWALTTVADLHTILRDYTTSNEYLLKALEVYNSIGYTRLQGIYELLGRNCNNQGDFKHAFQYALLALKAANTTHDSTMQLATIDNLLGSLYRNASRPELSIGYYKEGLQIALEHKDPLNVLLMAHILSGAYLDLNQPREALRVMDGVPPGLLDPSNGQVKALTGMIYMKTYYALGQLKRSYRYAIALEKLIEESVAMGEWTDVVCIELARYYLNEHNSTKARWYLEKGLAIPMPPNSPLWMKRYDTRYKVDSAEGNYARAFFDLLTYKTFADSLYNEVKTRQFQQLDVEFETSKKADSISLLTQRSDLQTANLQQAQLIRNITFAGIVLTVVIIGLLYRQYHLKQRNNKEIAIRNDRLEHLLTEKEWLLQEVHHRVKNNLQTIVSLLELQSDNLGEDAQFALQTSQNRIYATSLLHQNLYMSENLSSVDMKIYISELIQHLKEVFSVDNRTAITTNIASVDLDVSQGVPVGLIVNEAITNSFKYAFDESIVAPEVEVTVSTHGGIVSLVIKDNGVGFDSAREHHFGHGLKLVKGLAAQIGGKATIFSNKGTTVEVQFRQKGTLAPASDLSFGRVGI